MDGGGEGAAGDRCPLARQSCRELLASVGAARADLDRTKQDLISTVNHELRTPLSSILGYCELLDDLTDLDPTTRSMVGAIQRNSRRLVTLITDLLLLARLDAGTPGEDWETVDLVTLVAAVAERVAAEASAAGLAVRVDLPRAPVPVMGERDLLDRAVHHLAANAVKFAVGGRYLTVRVELLDPDGEGMVVIEVSDDGPGIAPVELPEITGRFVRADAARRGQVPGAGLGLSVVASVAAHHGGWLDLASRPGEGCTARIRLPVASSPNRSRRTRGLSMSPR